MHQNLPHRIFRVCINGDLPVQIHARRAVFQRAHIQRCAKPLRNLLGLRKGFSSLRCHAFQIQRLAFGCFWRFCGLCARFASSGHNVHASAETAQNRAQRSAVQGFRQPVLIIFCFRVVCELLQKRIQCAFQHLFSAFAQCGQNQFSARLCRHLVHNLVQQALAVSSFEQSGHVGDLLCQNPQCRASCAVG